MEYTGRTFTYVFYKELSNFLKVHWVFALILLSGSFENEERMRKKMAEDKVVQGLTMTNQHSSVYQIFFMFAMSFTKLRL